MDADALLLSRIQFAFTISFHIIFPAFTIGLASYLAVLEGMWLRTRRAVFKDLYKFWVKLFAISFGMGVVSGIVMSYQFGTNWAEFSERAGNVLGPLLAYEVLTAFFLEASFLGIMLFGWNKVGEKLHFTSTLLVAAGTLVSAFWILAANSWMHTPAGHELRDGIFFARDWGAVVFNPSFPFRFVHMTLAAYLTTGFVVAATAAWHLLRRPHSEHGRVMIRMAVGFVAIVVPLQILAGDLHGLNSFEHQPTKVAAMEAHWEGGEAAPLILFALPDEQAETNRAQIAIPYLGSLILTHSPTGEVHGLKNVPAADRPPVAPVFWSFRVMLAVGFLMLAAAVIGLIQWARGRLEISRPYLRFLVVMGPSGFVAVLAGWLTTEIGRQPWLVHGLMRTAEGVSAVAGGAVGASLAVFMLVYAIIFGAGLVYILRSLAAGPAPAAAAAAPEFGAGTPQRPLSAAGEVAPTPAGETVYLGADKDAESDAAHGADNDREQG